MNDYRLYLFDADGTLRRCTVPRQPCPNRPGEWELIPGVKERLSQIAWSEGRSMGIVSNQGGVALRLIDRDVAYQMLVDTYVAAMGAAPPEDAIVMCPHAPRAGCACRKPKPALLQRLMQRFGCAASETVFVGDQDSDRDAAERAGVAFVWAKDFFGG